MVDYYRKLPCWSIINCALDIKILNHLIPLHLPDSANAVDICFLDYHHASFIILYFGNIKGKPQVV